MASVTPDYAALAAQFGGTPVKAPAQLDYAALAARFGGTPVKTPDPGGAPPDAGAQMRSSVLKSAGASMDEAAAGDSVQRPIHPYGGAPVVTAGTQAAPGTPGAGIANQIAAPGIGAIQMVHGAERMTEPGWRAKAGGASQIIRGGMKVASPVIAASGVAAPLETAASLALGAGASDLTEGTLKAAGVPNEYAELGGDVAGLAVPSAAHTEVGGRVLDAVNAGVDRVRNVASDKLGESAEKNIGTFINPTTKINKALVRDTIAPGLIERGVIATSLKDLNEQAEAKAEEFGQKIDDRFDAHADAGHTTSPKPIIAALEAEKGQNVVKGQDLTPAYTKALDDLQKQIQAISDESGGPISLDDLRKVRQTYDKTIKRSKGGFALPEDEYSKVAALKTYTNAIRGSIADFDPALAADNKEFSFWQNVADVTDASLQRKTGQKPGLSKRVGQVGAGTVAAAVTHNPLTIAGAAKVGGMLGDFMQSAAWNTVAAQVKTRIADLIRTGDTAGATALAKQNGVVPATTAQPAANASQSNGVTNGQATASNTGTTPQGVRVPAAVQPTSQTQTGSSGTTVKVPGQSGPGYQARYRVRELDDINGSHNGLTFNPNAEYKLKNDRNYSNKANQGKVVSASSDAEFDPKYHITDNPDATNGPVITDSDGNVVGGNGRTMILQRIYNAKGKAAASYRQILTQRAAQFGLDPADIDQFKHPVLTREIPDSEFAAKGSKQKAVTDFNKVGTASLTPSERAIADSNRVSNETLDHVAGQLESGGDKASISSVLDGKSGEGILDKLITDGVISPQERAGLANENGLTKDGKERVGKLLVGRFFESSGQMDSVPLSVRAKIERMAAPVAATEGLTGEWNIVPKVREAVGIVDAAKKAGVPNISDFLKQDGLFGAAGKYSPEAVTLAKALSVSKSADVVAAARQFAQDAKYAGKGTSLMGNEPTFQESFDESFGKLKSGASVEAEAKAAVPGSAEFRKLPYSKRKAIEDAKKVGALGSERGSFSNKPEQETGPHGPIFRQYAGKAAEAIAKLREEQAGEAPGALTHPEVGGIDLIWGGRKYGLAKIVERHPEVLNNLQEIISGMSEQPEKRTENTIFLQGGNHEAVIRRNWMGNPKTWLLTAFGQRPKD